MWHTAVFILASFVTGKTSQLNQPPYAYPIEGVQPLNAAVLASAPSSASEKASSQGSNVDSFQYLTSVKSPPLAFDPPSLDFGDRPICIAAMQLVQVRGATDVNIKSVFMDSWLHFHPTLVREQVITAAGGSTSSPQIKVIFLPRIVGSVTGTLFVETSVGNFMLSLSGAGVENPYRVSPVLGHKLPVDKNFQKPITIFNPHDDLLKLKEIYTSESFLLLSLPNISQDTNGGQVKLWEIPPHQSKNVIFLNFRAQHSGKYQGFVHVKTNVDNLIIHMEFLVSKSGVNRLVEELDFDTMISPSEVRRREVALINSGTTPVLIKEVYLANPDTALQISFKPVILEASAALTVANVTYQGVTEGTFSGKVLVRTNDTSPLSSRIELPYHARVIHGALEYNSANTSFYTGTESFFQTQHTLVLWNTFRVPLLFRSATVADGNFELSGFMPGSVINADETKTILTVKFQPNSTDLFYTTMIMFDTNVTRLYVPLHSYHGQLLYVPLQSTSSGLFSPPAVPPEPTSAPVFSGNNVATPEYIEAAQQALLPNQMEFGVIGLNEPYTFNFSLTNPNPVPVTIKEWETDLENLKLRYIGMASDDGQGTQQLILQTGQSQVFIAELTALVEEEKWGYVEFQTSHKVVHIDVHYTSMVGTLTFTEPPKFEGAFPGHLLQRPLVATSSFSKTVQVTSITSTDQRFVPVLTQPLVEPGKTIEIGHVIFDASLVPNPHQKYLINQADTAAPSGTVADEPTSSALQVTNDSLPPLSLDDLRAYKERYELYLDLQRANQNSVTATLSFATDTSMRYTMALRGGLVQPHIATVPAINFDMGQIGANVSMYIPVRNPSDLPLAVQLLSLNEVSHVKEGLTILRKSNGRKLTEKDLTQDTPTAFSVSHAEGSSSIVLGPHQTGQIGPIVFRPLSAGPKHAIFFLRNNLSYVDAVEVHGQGGQGKLVFKSGASQIRQLHMFIQPSKLQPFLTRSSPSLSLSAMLRALSTNLSSLLSPTIPELTFTKPFYVANVGNMFVQLRSLSIANHGCRVYGLVLEPCNDTVLHPGEQIEMMLHFTPDFSTSLLRLQLVVETSSAKILTFPIEISLPHELLGPLYDTTPHTLLDNALRWLVIMLSVILWLYSCKALYFNFYCVDLEQLLERNYSPEGTNSAVASPPLPSPSKKKSGKKHSPEANQQDSSSTSALVFSAPSTPSGSPILTNESTTRLTSLGSGSSFGGRRVSTEQNSETGDETPVVQLEPAPRSAKKVTLDIPQELNDSLSEIISPAGSGVPDILTDEERPQKEPGQRPQREGHEKDRQEEGRERREKRERVKKEQTAADKERREKERRERREKERREKEKKEREEKERLEKEREKAEKEEREKREKERKEREDRERKERERREKEEKERREKEEKERKEKEEKELKEKEEQEQKEKEEQERKEKEEKERKEKEKERKEKEEAERKEKEEAERLEKEQEMQRQKEKILEEERAKALEREKEKEREKERQRERQREKEREREREREKEREREQEREREKERERERERERMRERERQKEKEERERQLALERERAMKEKERLEQEQRRKEQEQRRKEQEARERQEKEEKERQEQQKREREEKERQEQEQQRLERGRKEKELLDKEQERRLREREEREREQRAQREYAQMELFQRMQRRLQEQRRMNPGITANLSDDYALLMQSSPPRTGKQVAQPGAMSTMNPMAEPFQMPMMKAVAAEGRHDVLPSNQELELHADTFGRSLPQRSVTGSPNVVPVAEPSVWQYSTSGALPGATEQFSGYRLAPDPSQRGVGIAPQPPLYRPGLYGRPFAGMNQSLYSGPDVPAGLAQPVGGQPLLPPGTPQLGSATGVLAPSSGPQPQLPGSTSLAISPPQFSLFTPQRTIDPFGIGNRTASGSMSSFFSAPMGQPTQDPSESSAEASTTSATPHPAAFSNFGAEERTFNPFSFPSFTALPRPQEGRTHPTSSLFSFSPFAHMQQQTEGSADAADLLRNIHGLEE